MANSPLLLLSSLLCIAGVVKYLTKGRVFKASVLAIIATLPITAMAITLQRASLGYVALFSVVLVVLTFINAPRRGLWLVALLGTLAVMLGGDIFGVFEALFQKTREHGLNMRIEEWRSVWALSHQSWATLLFGHGWGTAFESPAVAGVRVNFTHSLFSSMLLKAGLVGVLLAFGYLAGFARLLWAQLHRNQVLALAILGPFIIDVLFYATFKSLDFGLLLLLISAGIVASNRT